MKQNKELHNNLNDMYSGFSIAMLIAYIFSMIISYNLIENAIFGGLLFMISRFANLFIQFLYEEYKYLLKTKGKVLFYVVSVLIVAILSLLLMSMPILIKTYNSLVAFILVSSLILMHALQNKILESYHKKNISKTWLIFIVALLYIISIVLSLILLGKITNPIQSLLMLLGMFMVYLIQLMETLRLSKTNLEFKQISTDDIKLAYNSYNQASSYRIYSYLSFAVLLCIQIVALISFSFIALTVKNALILFILFVVITLLVINLANFINKGFRKGQKDYVNWLYIGLFLIAYSLFLFSKIKLSNMDSTAEIYMATVICALGLATTLSSLARIEEKMCDVALFINKDMNILAHKKIRFNMQNLASFLGQFFALIVLVGIYHYKDNYYSITVFQKLKPLMLLPALFLVMFSILMAVKFPINARIFKKLSVFLNSDIEIKNPALKKQLENVLIGKYKKRFGVKLIMSFLRPLFYHKCIGVENIEKYKDGSMIFISNHGEFYGPVVANLYVPCSFRPWMMSELLNKESFIQYSYKYTFSQFNWLPKSLQMPMTKFFAPIMLWVGNSMEGIPVYRNSPHMLKNTFKTSIEAMQSGENLLIFPENPNASSEGYSKTGLGELYTGFAILGQLYYNKTGENAKFIPVFANKQLRLISFGEAIEYNPNNQPIDEKLRIVAELEKSMKALEKEQWDIYGKK